MRTFPTYGIHEVWSVVWGGALKCRPVVVSVSGIYQKYKNNKYCVTFEKLFFCCCCYRTLVAICGPGSSVGIATDFWLDGPGSNRDFPPVQTGPGAHPASCTMGTGSFLGVKCGQGVTLTPHPLLVLWSRKSRSIPLLPPHGSYGLYGASVPVQARTLSFYLLYLKSMSLIA